MGMDICYIGNLVSSSDIIIFLMSGWIRTGTSCVNGKNQADAGRGSGGYFLPGDVD